MTCSLLAEEYILLKNASDSWYSFLYFEPAVLLQIPILPCTRIQNAHTMNTPSMTRDSESGKWTNKHNHPAVSHNTDQPRFLDPTQEINMNPPTPSAAANINSSHDRAGSTPIPKLSQTLAGQALGHPCVYIVWTITTYLLFLGFLSLVPTSDTPCSMTPYNATLTENSTQQVVEPSEPPSSTVSSSPATYLASQCLCKASPFPDDLSPGKYALVIIGFGLAVSCVTFLMSVLWVWIYGMLNSGDARLKVCLFSSFSFPR